MKLTITICGWDCFIHDAGRSANLNGQSYALTGSGALSATGKAYADPLPAAVLAWLLTPNVSCVPTENQAPSRAEPMCLRCAETGTVVEFFQNDAGEADESDDFCECPTGQRHKAQLAAQQEDTRVRRLASQVAHLGATGLCFQTPDGADYNFSAAGIEAAARDAGWHYGKLGSQ